MEWMTAGIDPLNDTLQDVYQASHYQFVASALAVKAIHEIDSQAKVGSVIEYKTIYPMSCDPKDSLVVCREKQRGYFFSDVQVRGKYPGICMGSILKIMILTLNIRMRIWNSLQNILWIS